MAKDHGTALGHAQLTSADVVFHACATGTPLLVSFGYRRVTVDEVARRAGVGKGTVYLYWPSKWELFAAVLTREAANLLVE